MKKRILIMAFGIILAIIIGTAKVEAANANITASKTTVEVGENVTITVNFTAAAWNLKVSGDGVSNKGYAAQTADLSEQTTTDTLSLDTSKVGAYTIRLSGDITDKDGNVIEGINKTVTVTVKEKTVAPPEKPTDPGTTIPQEPEKPKKSTNANLKELGINPKDYDFNNFKPNRINYTATVPNDVEEVEVWYKVEDSKATAKVTAGSGLKVNNGKVSGLKEGKNTITVIVTAESGATKKYTIAVTRKAANEPEQNPTETTTPEEQEIPEETTPQEDNEITEKGDGIKELNIAGITLTPQFDTDIYDYEAVLKEDKDKLDIEVETTSEEYKVVIAGNEYLKDGENIISLIVYDAQNTVVATYQITVMKNTVDQNEVNNIFGQIKKEEMIKTIGIISVIALIVILTIVYIVIKTKMKKNKNKENIRTNQNREEDDEEFFKTIKSDKLEDNNEFDEKIKDSILEEDNLKIEDISEEVQDKPRRTKEDLDEKIKLEIEKENYTQIDRWEEFRRRTETNEIEDVNNISQTEKKKGKHF